MKDTEIGAAFEQLTVGKIFVQDNRRYRVLSKNRMSLRTCPYCKSKKTFHSECKKLGLPFNVYDQRQRKGKNIIVYEKENLCLKCGRLWIAELYIHKKLKASG